MKKASRQAWTAAVISATAAVILASPAQASQVSPPKPVAPPTLPSGEQNLINVFKRVSPGVVAVANKAVLQNLDDYQLYEIPQGAGSGFVWDRKGHIISNFHVVYGASSLQVTLSGGKSYPAEVVGSDADSDLVVLKIKAPPEVLTPLEPGRSSTLQVGQTVLAIGNPFGLDTSLSVGVVSALGRRIDSMTRHSISDVIQTDAAINPGNSGGPLLDSSGRLVGINTAIVSPSGAYAGIGFAVPVDTIRRIVPQLIETGHVKRPVIGIRMLPAASVLSGETGVVILAVVPGGPAARAGLQGIRRTRRGDLIRGDIITAIGNAAVNSPEDISAILDKHEVGDEVKVTVRRGNAAHTVSMKLADGE